MYMRESPLPIVKALAPASKTMPSSACEIKIEKDTSVLLEVANVAVSDASLGTVAGVQLLAVSHSPVAGLAFHVALPAMLLLGAESKSVRTPAAIRRKARAQERKAE